MRRSLTALVSILREFGALIVFYATNHFLGLRWAIGLSTLYSIVEIARRMVRKEALTALFKFSTVMTVLFGAVDLLSGGPMLFKYEAAISNVTTAVFFGGTLLGRKSVLQEFYEKRPGARPVTPDLALYFRALTMVWVTYFLAKAAVYCWIARHYDLEKGLALRLVLGNVTFYALLGISIFGSPHLFRALKRWGAFPTERAGHSESA